MRSRAEFLASIQTGTQKDFAGTWETLSGRIVIQREAGGMLSVAATAVDQYAGRWICDASGKAKPEGRRLSIVDDQSDSTLILKLEGAVLNVQENPKLGEGESPAYCGVNGSLAGTYFRVK